MGVYMKNFGCSSTSAVVSLKFIMVQMHLNASDYSLKFHVSQLPQISLHYYRLINSQSKDF